ncbi:MAG: hypothetical protein AB9866_00710 [Syntrophobacteraceae bacterium]
MLLNVGEIEIEIREEAFVCIDRSDASCFCEWEQLSPELQEAFREFRKDMMNRLQELLASEHGPAFLALAEEYKIAPRDKGCPDFE